MSEWTPGPWAVEADMRSNMNRYGEADEGEYLAGWNITSKAGDVVGIEGITDESPANAHLIAAAPDLYKALAAIMNHHASKVLFGNRQMADNAWNALAKARGEAQ